jgi:hypothetical protein
MNVVLDATALSDVELPEELQPTTVALNESYSVAQFYLLNDNITGVLALGSFSAANFSAFMGSLLDGLQELKSLGATRLIVDVVGASSYNLLFRSKLTLGDRQTTEEASIWFSQTKLYLT